MIQEVIEIDTQITELATRRKQIIDEAHATCAHPIEARRECAHRPAEYIATSPPIRVCTICGYAEEGWGCGYWKLKEPFSIPEIERDELMKYVLRLYTRQELNEIRFA